MIKTKAEMNKVISIRQKKLFKDHPEKFKKWLENNKEGKHYQRKMKTYWNNIEQRKKHLLGLLKYNREKGFNIANLVQKIKELES